MLTCEDCQMLLADSLYERLTANDQQGLDEHLASCAECQALQQELNDSTLQLRTATAAHRDEAPALDDLWTKLEPSLDRVDAQRYHRMASHGWRRLSGGALALAASLVLAVTVVFQGSQRAEPVATPSTLAARITAPEFQNYLDRAQAVMLVLANADQNGGSNSIPLDRDYAGLMAIEARLLNASLGSQLSASQQKLLSDVEFLLVQFANIDDDNLDEGLAMLRLYLQDNTVLFRMNLARMKQPQVI